MALLVTSMAKTTIQHHWDIATTIGECDWLSNEHLKIPPPLSCKLFACFSGQFLDFCTISPVSFQLQLMDYWAIHNVFYSTQIERDFGILDASNTPFHPDTNDSGDFKVQDILDSRTVNLYGQFEYFLMHLKGYFMFESTLEPQFNSINCFAILCTFLLCCG